MAHSSGPQSDEPLPLADSSAYIAQKLKYKDSSKIAIRILSAPYDLWINRDFLLTPKQYTHLKIVEQKGSTFIYNPEYLVELFKKAFPKALRRINQSALEDIAASEILKGFDDENDDSSDIPRA